jgi:hypothetical protein
VLVLLYAGLHLWPDPLFPNRVSAAGMTIYSRARLPPEAAECAARAAALIARSELAVPGRNERVFVCDSPWLFHLFNPVTSGFAYSVPVSGNCFVGHVDFEKDLVRHRGPDFNTRKLSAVIAHEATHGLIRRRVGWLRGLTVPDWVAEGYCDHVAQESSFPEDEGLRLLAEGPSDPSIAFRYFTYRQMVRYLIEERGLSFEEVLARSEDKAAVEAETRAWLKSRTSP